MTKENQEISYLDMLLILAENARMLIFAPMVIALITFSVGIVTPLKYTSVAIFSVIGPASATALERMESHFVSDRLSYKYPLFVGMSKTHVKQQLAEQVKIVRGKDNLTKLEVTTENPEQSKILATAILEEWNNSDVFEVSDRIDLEQRLEYAKAGLNAVNEAILTNKMNVIIPARKKIQTLTLHPLH